jgi:hypothetical protein
MKEIEAKPKALAPAEPPAPEPVVEEVQAEASPPPPPVRKEAPARVEERPRPKLFVPDRPPDDPGVAQAETDESPTSLERLRAAQIRRG